MTVHQLKISPNYMDAIKSGEKKFEDRRDDRGFQKGDVLELCRYGPSKDQPSHSIGYLDANERYQGRSISGGVDTIKCRVLWILTGGQLGIKPGYVVMSIEPLPTQDKEQ